MNIKYARHFLTASQIYAANIPAFIQNYISHHKIEKEIVVIAQRRSGHHAIINWLRANLDGPSIFANDCNFHGGPYRTGNRINIVTPPSTEECPAPEVKNKVHCLIYNFEDKNIHSISLMHTRFNRIAWLGKSNKLIRILILRDPFNMIASKFHWSKGKKIAPNRENLMHSVYLWKQYAGIYLKNMDNYSDYLCIDYNSWFKFENVKKLYARRLELISYSKGVDLVARYGPAQWGDSFDGFEYDNQAQSMNVLTRWKHYISDSHYKNLINDQELIGLTKIIYKDFPEIEEIYGHLDTAKVICHQKSRPSRL